MSSILELCHTLGYRNELAITLRHFSRDTAASEGIYELDLVHDDLKRFADQWLSQEGIVEKYWRTGKRRKGIPMWGPDKEMITATVRKIFLAQWKQRILNLWHREPWLFKGRFHILLRHLRPEIPDPSQTPAACTPIPPPVTTIVDVDTKANAYDVGMGPPLPKRPRFDNVRSASGTSNPPHEGQDDLVKTLLEQNEAIQDERKKLLDEKNNLLRMCNELQDKLSAKRLKFQIANTELVEKNEELSKSNTSLSEKLAIRQARNDVLQKRNDALRENTVTLEEKNVQSGELQEKVSKLLEDKVAHYETVARLQAQRAELTDKNVELAIETVDVKSKNAELLSEVSQLKEKVNSPVDKCPGCEPPTIDPNLFEFPAEDVDPGENNGYAFHGYNY